MADHRAQVLADCQRVFASWRHAGIDHFDFDDPKGFSSFTMGVRARPGVAVDPDAVLYRRLADKENAILDHDVERAVFLGLGEAGIAAHCHHYERDFRIEEFYRGHTLSADDVFDPNIARAVADELYRFHQLEPQGLPDQTYFELLFERWRPLVRRTLVTERHRFPDDEQALCDDLLELLEPETRRRALNLVGDRAPVFCHNDTYHGNAFLCDDGTVKLLDFEFSCLNTPAFDMANFFAETTMVHGLVDPPHFTIAEPRFDATTISTFVGYYLDNATFASSEARLASQASLSADVMAAVALSDVMYAMAALPLALEPIQKLRFVPYAHRRFCRFLAQTAT